VGVTLNQKKGGHPFPRQCAWVWAVAGHMLLVREGDLAYLPTGPGLEVIN
jgi:hypothetical protein